jgi:pyruvate dehydrogenase E2 component (dihydrolipoamide acetyltransferase)
VAVVKVPDIGDFDEVPVIEILVSEGDEVTEEQGLVTLESDKATMDVPSPVAGKVASIAVSVGDKVSEGSSLMEIESGDDSGGDEDPGAKDEDSGDEGDSGDEKQEAAEEAEDSDDGPVDEADEPETEKDSGPRPPAPVGKEIQRGAEGRDTEAGGADSQKGVLYAGPGVRRMARELGIDLAKVKGSGRKGRILKEDVQKAKDQPAAAAEGAGIPGLDLAPWPKVNFEKYGEVERVPLSRIKKISGPALARNWVMIPHVTHDDESDITDLEAFRKEVNAEQKDVKVTMVALLVKACVAALRQFPDFNSSLDGDELVIKRYYNIGFAADTPQGLLVPVIKEADRKGILDIARELGELSEKAREGKISAEEMRGSTFTISSLGGIGGTSFTPIINAPEVAILGVTRSKMKPVWDPEAEEFVPRLMVPLSLSYDHRVIDGAAAARFVAHLAAELTDLRRALL